MSYLLRAQIGRYTLENGNTTAVRHFTKKFDTSLNESTVQSLRKSYISVPDAQK